MDKLTLFDFDGTLTTGDSFTGFIRHVHGLPGLIRILMVSAPAILLWKLGFRSNTYAKLKMFSAAFKGMPLAEFKRQGEEYVAGIDAMTRPSMIAELERAKREGRRPVIVSASIDHWIAPWAKAHGIDDVVATEVETDAEGRLTGGFSTPNCQREEKVRRLLERFPDIAKNRDRYDIEAYGDSSGDTEMLRFADRGVQIRKTKF